METVDKICRKKFEEWAIQELLIKEGEDYEGEPAWEAWKRSWVRARSITIAKEKERYIQFNRPLAPEKIKEMWLVCSKGIEFARLIESAHGIR